MKICFLCPSLTAGGAERTVVYLANYAVKNGLEAEIALYGERGFYELDERVKIHVISEPKVVKNIFSRLITTLKRFSGFAKYFKKNKPDIIYPLLYGSMIYALPFQRNTPIVVSERALPSRVKSKLLMKIRNYLFKKADGAVFQTQRAKDYYQNIIGDKGIIIPNSIGNELVFRVPENIERKKKISAMGRLSKQKDFATLIRAFKIVSDKYPDYSLEIFGKGELENELKNLVKELNLVGKVIFAGVAPDAILKMADSECFVLSSLFEGMPNALMEAMAIGLPCVSTDCPNGPAELIENGVNGLLVPVGDANAIAYAILRYIEDKDFAKMCGQNASKIKETHSVEKNAGRFLKYFVEIVNGRRR